MKKLFILTIVLVYTIAGANSQPKLGLEPGDKRITLRGNSGTFVTTPTHYEVYRGLTNPPSTLYTTFEDGANYEWVDTDVDNGTFYYYRIKARDDNAGTITNFSTEAGSMPVVGSGGYYTFDGVNDNVQVQNSGVMNATRKLEFRVLIDEIPAGKQVEILRIFDQSTEPRRDNEIRVFHTASSLDIVFYRHDWYDPDPEEYIASTINIADGGWHNISINELGFSNTSITVDGVTRTLRIENRFPEFRFPVRAGYNFGTHTMIFGGRSNATTAFLKGAIDNIKLIKDGVTNHHWRFDEPANETKAYNSASANPSLTKIGGVGAVRSRFGPITAVNYDDSVSVRWKPDADLARESIVSYELWRKEGNGAYQMLTTISKDDTSYMDRTVELDKVYEYQIRSVKTNNITLRSKVDFVKPVDSFDRFLKLDGVGEVQVQESDLFTGNSGTIEFRIKANSAEIESGNSYSILNKHDGSGSLNGFNFILDRSNLYVQVKDNGTQTSTIAPSTPISLIDNEWHHVAFTFEWEGTSTLYIDGVEQATINNTPDVTLSQQPFRIGKSPASFWTPFKGGVDEVRIWDQALTSTEINNRKDLTISGDEDGLKALWRFDTPTTEGVAYDDGVNGFDGEIIGALATTSNPTGRAYASYDETNVLVQWEFQSGESIAGYKLSRNRVGAPSSTQVLEGFTTATSYTDSNVEEHEEYEYIVEAITATVPIVATDFISIKQELGNMLDFGSGGGEVEIDESVTDNQQGTIEFRFRSDTEPSTGKSFVLLSRTDVAGGNNGYTFTHSASSVFVQMKADGNNFNIFVNKDYLDGEWHHMALVYNWNGENNLYIDGQLEGTVTVNNLSITDQPLFVGAAHSTFWEPYEGQLDELRLWEKQLTSVEINASKDVRLPGNTADLGAVWHFDESTINTALDNGPNNFDGTLGGEASIREVVGRLTFGSNSGGFFETAGNNGGIDGDMIINLTGENAFVNPGGVMNTNFYQLLNSTSGGAVGSLFTGLTPVLNVSADGKQAVLTFSGEADVHVADESTPSVRIGFTTGAFQNSTEVLQPDGESNIVYVLQDNNVPFAMNPFQQLELQGGFAPFSINMQSEFTDPDFGQPFTYEAIKDNNLVNATMNGSILNLSPDEIGEGPAEVTVIFSDGNGGEATVTYLILIEQLDQLITTDPVLDVDLASQSTVQINASSTSGLDVALELLDGDGSLNASGLLTINATGSFRISANQAGTALYKPAEEVIITFNAVDSRKQDQSITFTDDLSRLTYGDAAIMLGATASSGLDVTYNTTGPVEVNGSTLTILGAGSASVMAVQTGDNDFNPAFPATINFTVNKAILTATPDDVSISFGEETQNFTISYDGFIGDDNETDIDMLPQASTLADIDSNVGTYPIDIDGGQDDNYSFDYVEGTLTINKADQVITFSPISDVDIAQTSQRTMNASASSGLAIQFDLLRGIGTIEGNKVLIEQTGVFEVAAVQVGNENYNAAPFVSQTFLVTNSNKTNQTITFEIIPDAVYGDVVEFNATSSSGMPVNIEVLSGQGELSGNTLTLTGLGTYEIEATQEGDNEFNPAPIVINTFEVTKAPLTITANDITIAEGDAIPNLTLTYDGFKLEEDASVLDVVPAINTSATATSAVGTYDIVLEGGSDDFYDLTLVNGTLIIEAALSVGETVLTVYPNPAVDRLHVSGVEVATMRLLTLEGKEVQMLSNTTEMDVSKLTSGKYILQLQDESGNLSTHRIIKR